MSSINWVGRSIGGRYQVESMLGQGGMSAVYRATDPNLRRPVAVKLIHPHLSSDPEFVRRFEQEAAAVAQLRHPNIIQVYDFNHDGEVYYMVLEFVPGETLQSRLKTLHAASELLPLPEVVSIMATVCDAVDYAHHHGMIHRDLKPANVMLDLQGHPILMDFGVAKMVGGQQHTATGAIVGTVAYMAPEQIRGAKVDERADIYSLGIMLYEMTAGRPPFEGDSAMTVMFKHVNEPPPDIRQFNAKVPDEFKEVVQKALAKDPTLRYQSAAEMAQALRGLKLFSTAVTPPPATTVVAGPAPQTVARPAEPAPAAVLNAPPAVAPVTPPVTSTTIGAPAATVPAAKQGGLPMGVLIGAGVLAVIVFAAVILFAARNGGRSARSTETAVAVAQVSSTPKAAATVVPLPTQAAPTAAPKPTEPKPTAPPAPTAVPLTDTPAPPPAPPGMVLIPGGQFDMGSPQGNLDERPVHPVSLHPYFIDKFEVTNEAWGRCMAAQKCRLPVGGVSSPMVANYLGRPEYQQYPVIQVTWDQAANFCQFAGKRLPTEAEWEFAAKGPGNHRYPWGDTFDPARVPAQSNDTVKVGSLDNASGFGVFDLSGNVAEWVADWYGPDYYARLGENHNNPTGPLKGTRRVYRGGSYGNGDGAFYTTTRRYSQSPGYHDSDIGFRCAQDAP